MKLSKNTIDILKNFSSINQGITVKAGNVLRTCSVAKNIIGEATVDESFPQEFSIYDLNEFLATTSLFKECTLTFGPKSVTIGDTNTKSKATYYYCDSSVVVAPPDKKIKLPSVDVSFELTAEQLATMLKASSILQAPDICVRGEKGELKLVATDLSNPSSNDYAIVVDDAYTGPDCNFIVKAVNLKIINDTYKVEISKALVLHMISAAAGDLEYWIALEKSSTCS